MSIIFTFFMFASGCGFLLSFIEHVSALFGIPSSIGQFSKYLNFGLFVVWLPAVLAANSLAKDFKQREFWKAVLRACPKWMKNMSYFFFGYAILNFILFGIDSSVSGASPNPGRLSSGHLMAFYSVAMGILYSVLHVKEHDKTRRCPNGHPTSPAANFCEQCGAKIVEKLR